MSGRALKWTTVLVVIVGAGIALISTTQTWLVITLTGAAGHAAPLSIKGSDAAAAVIALGLAGLALALALAIAGRVTRIVVGILGLAVAVCLIWAAAPAATELRGGYDQITAATGIAGHESVIALIARVDGQWWRFVPFAGAVLVGLGSLAAVVLGGFWPQPSRRYESSTRLAPAKTPASASDAAVSDWDDLTRGDDPSER